MRDQKKRNRLCVSRGRRSVQGFRGPKFPTLLIGERAPSHNAIVSGECSVSSGVRLEIGAVLAQFRPDRRSDVFKLMKKCKNLDPDRWRASTWRRSPRTPITQTPTYLHELFSGAQNPPPVDKAAGTDHRDPIMSERSAVYTRLHRRRLAAPTCLISSCNQESRIYAGVARARGGESGTFTAARSLTALLKQACPENIHRKASRGWLVEATPRGHRNFSRIAQFINKLIFTKQKPSIVAKRLARHFAFGRSWVLIPGRPDLYTYHLPSPPILNVPIPNLPVSVAEKAMESLSSPPG
ncbi:hypothetical protein GEV33_006164 [Tenebrio molitor]|uniref:Uncharacterized protein n=1 Tax=Tenebrio molitor TaxID=7067 RepID=A0A8J6HMC2_TENMO|nr:hypothetical protein GEV33_006164 [Tenebrio molitor]